MKVKPPIPARLIFAAVAFGLLSEPAKAEEACILPGRADPEIAAKLTSYSVPPLDCGRLHLKYAKLDPANVEFSFFRTAVPWYWDFLRRDRACADRGEGIVRPELHRVMKAYTGLCAGDAHPENFAVLFPPEPAAPTFSVNDPDDATKDGPLLADYFRLVVATKLGMKGANTAAMTAKYIAALEANPPLVPSSPEVARLTKLGANEETKLPKGATCPPEVFAKLIQSYTVLRAINYVAIDPAPVPADCVDESAGKPSGGSGGLPRYTIRFSERRGARKTPIFVQFKATQKNGPAFRKAPPEPWNAKDRYLEGCDAERGDAAKPCHVIATDSDGNGFFVRTKSEQGVKLEKIPAGDSQALLEDEAIVLANLHRSNLSASTKLPEYIAALKTVQDAIEVDAGQLAGTTRKTAEAAKAAIATPMAADGFGVACSVPKTPSPNPASPSAIQRAPAKNKSSGAI